MEPDNEIEYKVLEETKRFNSVRPNLVKQYLGKWVVFIKGAVVSNHIDEASAYRSAIEHYGADGGFVIAQVEDIVPTVLPEHNVSGLTC